MTWQQAKLGDVCEVLRGATLTQAQARPGRIPVVAGGIAPTYFHDTPNRPGGTITVSASGANAGYVNFWDRPIFASDCSTVRADGCTVDIRFMYHQLRAKQRDINGLRTGAAQPHVYAKDIAQLSVAVPPIIEQRRIAAILDKADALCTKRREALAQLDRLAQSIFVEMFGDPVANTKDWPRHPLGDLLSSIDSGWSPVCLERPAEGEEWGVLKLGAVTSCVYDFRANKALPPGAEAVPDIEVKPGDLLFSRKNTHELVAACAFVESTRPRLMMSDLIFRLQVRDESKLNKRFLHGLLTNPRKRAKVQKLAGGSAGSMPNISKAKLLALQIELPPIALQEEFASRVQMAGHIKDRIECAAMQNDLLLSSLQYRALQGDL